MVVNDFFLRMLLYETLIILVFQLVSQHRYFVYVTLCDLSLYVSSYFISFIL